MTFRVPAPSRFWKGRGFPVLRAMTKGLIRHYGHGHLHFITFSCYRRMPLLHSVRARNIFVKILGEVRARPARIHVTVVANRAVRGRDHSRGIQLA